MNKLQAEALKRKIRDLSQLLNKDPGSIVHLQERAKLWEQINNLGEAINDFKKIQTILPEDVQIKNRIHYLETILKFNNMDIFSNTNTSHDPWME